MCGREATRFGPLAIGQVARMHEADDALLTAFVPLCPHHAEMTPPRFKLLRHDEIGLVPSPGAIDG